MKRPTDMMTARKELFEAIDRGELTLAQTIKRMRKVLGKTQPEYARQAGVATEVLREIEQERGNPTLETLQKIAAPFGLTVNFRRRPSQSAE